MITSFICALGLYCWTTPAPVAEPLISQAQGVYLKRLEDCESSGSSTVKVLDTNNKFSYGLMQYQMQTWLTQSKKYNLNYKEEEIYDREKQIYLSHLILKDGGRSHWFNCTKPLGEYPP